MKEMENFADLGLMIWRKYLSQDPWDNLEIDGGELQEILVECGLLRKETRKTPCREIVECYVKCVKE